MKARPNTQGGVAFWCVGCNEAHVVTSTWVWNHDTEKPTFTPSVLVTSGHYCAGFKQGESCWCTYNAERPDNPAPFVCYRCHSFVTNGQIQYLSDSTHAYTGQTIALPEFPE